MASSNSLASWALVFNNVITGITAEVVGTRIELSSNLGTNNRAQLTIDQSSTLVSKGMFGILTGLSSHGAASDFVLNRNTAQFQLVVPLVAGDKLSAGDVNTAGRIQSTAIYPVLDTYGYF